MIKKKLRKPKKLKVPSSKKPSQTHKPNVEKQFRIGVWNVNSIGGTTNSAKLDAVEDFLSNDQLSILALTEYINTEDNSWDVVLKMTNVFQFYHIQKLRE